MLTVTRESSVRWKNDPVAQVQRHIVSAGMQSQRLVVRRVSERCMLSGMQMVIDNFCIKIDPRSKQHGIVDAGRKSPGTRKATWDSPRQEALNMQGKFLTKHAIWW